MCLQAEVNFTDLTDLNDPTDPMVPTNAPNPKQAPNLTYLKVSLLRSEELRRLRVWEVCGLHRKAAQYITLLLTSRLQSARLSLTAALQVDSITQHLDSFARSLPSI
jgi:hypothetical protein